METKGVIYVLTNPSFPDYVKIGYADDIEKRLKTLNHSECIPFAFRVYATYEIPTRLGDMKVHSIIDALRPDLRAIDSFNGKKRTKEFYAMEPEAAYKLLEAMAAIHGCTDKLKKWEATEDEKVAEETAELIEIEAGKKKFSEHIPIEDYLKNKNEELVRLYRQLEAETVDVLDNTNKYGMPQYIGWQKKGKNFAEIHILKNQIQMLTLPPRMNECTIGSRIPDTYLWTLNFRSYIDSLDDIEEAITVLKDSYEQR